MTSSWRPSPIPRSTTLDAAGALARLNAPILQLHPRIAAAAFGLLLLGAAFLRLTTLEAWPVFCDEDNYTFAVGRLRAQPLHEWVREVARCCAKPPLVFMAAVPLGHALHSDLVGLRVLSGLGGLVTVAGCFLLGRKLGGTTVGLATAALYAFSPWAVLHERMALLDGPVAALALLAALATWEAVQRSSWRLAACAALAGAAAVWAKQPGLLALGAPAFFALSRLRWRTAAVTGIAAAGPALAWLALHMAPGRNRLQYQLADRWAPFSSVGENWGRLQEALHAYLPAGFVLLVLLGTVMLLRRAPEGALFGLGQIVLWSASWILVSNFAPSRYHLPALPYAMGLAAYAALTVVPGWLRCWPRTGAMTGALIGVALAVPGALHSLSLVRDHRHAPLAALDAWQYRSGWPSGYGYPEAREFVRARATTAGPVVGLLQGCHQVAADCSSLPGVTPLGIVDPAAPDVVQILAQAPGDALLAIAEMEEAELLALEQRVAAAWTIEVLARFPRPGGTAGPMVLRLARRTETS